MNTAVPLDRPVTEFLSDTAFTLRQELTLDEALAQLRRAGSGRVGAQPQVAYFYVIDAEDRLVGVLPVRQLVLSPGGTRIQEIMLRDIVMLRAKETLFDALELFAMHRLLAIPVVDERERLLGIVEVSLYTDEVFELVQNRQLNEVFQLIGLHLEQQKHGSPWMGFRMRMPWLLSNITGGLICAALGSLFEATMQRVVLIALFIPLILTVAESVSVQSMTLGIELAAAGGGRKGGFFRQLAQEVPIALLLGACSGLLVGGVSLFWRGPLAASGVIAGAVLAAMFLAAMLGRIVPRAVHGLKLNPRIASGPVTLALVDIATITVYLSAAAAVLR